MKPRMEVVVAMDASPSEFRDDVPAGQDDHGVSVLSDLRVSLPSQEGGGDKEAEVSVLQPGYQARYVADPG